MTEPSTNLPPLWSHQKQAIEIAGNRHALFFDPGCGKTRTAIELIKKYQQRKVIVFSPISVCRNWENELKRYLGSSFIAFVIAGQSKEKKLNQLELFKAYEPSPGERVFLICNIESCRSPNYVKLITESKAECVIADESHWFKTPTSKQTKGLFTIVRELRPKTLWLLTGTPAPQGEMDLFTTFALLGKTRDTFFVWRKKYFADKNERRRGTRGYWPDYQITAKSKAYFQGLLKECSSVARKDEVLDLPPLLHTSLYAELSHKQARHYKNMLEYLFAIDEEGNELNAGNFLARSLRLQQILSGYLGEHPIDEPEDNQRFKTLDEAIEKTNGEQFIIWTIFKPTYGDVGKRLADSKISHGYLTGEQGEEDRQGHISAFQNGEIRALIAHPRVGGIGINLTAASYAIHYTRSFNLTDYMQAEARNYRGGSEIHKRIVSIDIITPGTIDEEISKALKEKRSVQDLIMGVRELYGR